MNIKTARAITGHTGGLGSPSKMPGRSTATSATACKTGSKLAKIPGSVCAGCYALKANYQYPSVKVAHARRLAALDNPQWVEAMAYLINKREGHGGWFRWHDSGDIQSVSHLRAIVAVCKATPLVKHWLPTRERRMVRSWLAIGGTVPPNLVIRLSAFMVGAPPPKLNTMSWRSGVRTVPGITTSTVSWMAAPDVCPAPQQDGECGDCRACWSRDHKNTDYRQH